MLNEAVIPARTVAVTAPLHHPVSTVGNPGSQSLEHRHVRLTYAEFENHVRRLLAAGGWSSQRVANIISALHGWMKVLGVSAKDIVAEELGTRFAQAFRRYEDTIATQLSSRTQKDRQEQLHK